MSKICGIPTQMLPALQDALYVRMEGLPKGAEVRAHIEVIEEQERYHLAGSSSTLYNYLSYSRARWDLESYARKTQDLEWHPASLNTSTLAHRLSGAIAKVDLWDPRLMFKWKPWRHVFAVLMVHLDANLFVASDLSDQAIGGVIVMKSPLLDVKLGIEMLDEMLVGHLCGAIGRSSAEYFMGFRNALGIEQGERLHIAKERIARDPQKYHERFVKTLQPITFIGHFKRLVEIDESLEGAQVVNAKYAFALYRLLEELIELAAWHMTRLTISWDAEKESFVIAAAEPNGSFIDTVRETRDEIVIERSQAERCWSLNVCTEESRLLITRVPPVLSDLETAVGKKPYCAFFSP